MVTSIDLRIKKSTIRLNVEIKHETRRKMVQILILTAEKDWPITAKKVSQPLNIRFLALNA
jgi:hypothetical protein